jgi:radical SAM superfamily enzyme YgiQ (UPF0313 family)
MPYVGETHPRGHRARVLLASVFGPYAQDDEYGSRAVDPMELYHNQVTRTQGVFSLRMFHRSWGLMMIQANLEAPCTLLDFPTLDRFIEEIRAHAYDVIGISAIQPNIEKVRAMCRLVRQYRPDAAVVIGGHVAGLPDLPSLVDADYIVAGEGIAWFRRFLGEPVDRPMRHPVIQSGFGARTMGVSLGDTPADTAVVLIPSVGCPMGCNFCATSAMFGGKGRSVTFYDSGDQLFEVMCRLEAETGSQTFFVMDENFLLYRRRALELLARMKEAGRPWSLYVFSSANSLRLYSMDELVGLGISWVWLGLEGEGSDYVKLRRTDTRDLVGRLQAHGIRVLGSSIIGLPEHSPDTIGAVIEHAVSHDTEFHQFMLYTPLPGTPLHAQHAAEGTLLDRSECPEADVHGQERFNFRHPRIPAGEETRMLLRAFERDFERNGPSVLRVVRTLLAGWRRHKNHPDPRVRERFRREGLRLGTTQAAGVWAAERWLAGNAVVAAKLRALRRDLVREFGWRARVIAPVVGSALLVAMRLEARRARRARVCEPPTFYDANPAALARSPGAALGRAVEAAAGPAAMDRDAARPGPRSRREDPRGTVEPARPRSLETDRAPAS